MIVALAGLLALFAVMGALAVYLFNQQKQSSGAAATAAAPAEDDDEVLVVSGEAQWVHVHDVSSDVPGWQLGMRHQHHATTSCILETIVHLAGTLQLPSTHAAQQQPHVPHWFLQQQLQRVTVHSTPHPPPFAHGSLLQAGGRRAGGARMRANRARQQRLQQQQQRAVDSDVSAQKVQGPHAVTSTAGTFLVCTQHILAAALLLTLPANLQCVMMCG
jgi:hypothetical protein